MVTRNGVTATNRSGLFQIVVVAAVVVLLLVITFVWLGEEPESLTDPEAGEVAQEPTGAGTVPEGNVDAAEEGITDAVDEVDPAAPNEDTVPAAEQGPAADAGEDDAGADDATTGSEGAASDQGGDAPTAETAPAEATDDAATGAGDGAEAPADTDGDDPQAVPVPDTDAASEPAEDGSSEVDTDAAPAEGDTGSATTEEGIEADTVADPTVADAPAGRDAGTVLTVEPGQDVVEDTDDGGTGFIATPSGPEGSDDDALTQD